MTIIRESFLQPRSPNATEADLLRVILELEQEALGVPPSLAKVAKHYGCSRQAVHYWVGKLRTKRLLEQGNGISNGCQAPGVILTHAGRQAALTAR